MWLNVKFKTYPFGHWVYILKLSLFRLFCVFGKTTSAVTAPSVWYVMHSGQIIMSFVIIHSPLWHFETIWLSFLWGTQKMAHNHSMQWKSSINLTIHAISALNPNSSKAEPWLNKFPLWVFLKLQFSFLSNKTYILFYTCAHSDKMCQIPSPSQSALRAAVIVLYSCHSA